MKLPNLPTKAQNMPTGIRSGVPEETGTNTPTLDEIYRRARQIHIERGGHACNIDNYLDEWLQAERELQGKGSTRALASNREGDAEGGTNVDATK